MRILYVTAEVPWPLTSGYLRHFHILKGLAERHRITQLSLTRRAVVPADAAHELGQIVERLEVFGECQAAGGSAARTVALRRAAVQLRRAVATELATDTYDAVILSGKDTFPAMAAVRRVPLVIDVCDAASLRFEGELKVARGAKRRALLRARLAEIRRIERRIVARTPHLLFASERDRDAVGATGGTVVPNGVDLDYWSRRHAPSGAPRIAFSGAMAYRPNDDAARRLVDGVLPLVREHVPAASLVLAGRDPLQGLLDAAAARGDVTVSGIVDDLRPLLDDASVYCAPLRFAAGIQNKLLEALAMHLPVVTTPVAAAGLQVAGSEPPVLVADDDAALADAVVGLLGDPERRRRLAEEGRSYVERHFSWPASVARVEAALTRAVDEQPSRVPARRAEALTGGPNA